MGRNYRERKAVHRERYNGRKVAQGRTYVYVIGIADGSGPVKIGISSKLGARLASLQTASPSKLKIHHSFSFPDRPLARAFEKLFHERFMESSMQGEWFGMSHEEAAEIITGILK